MLQPGDFIQISQKDGLFEETLGIYLGVRTTKWSDEHVFIVMLIGQQIEEILFHLEHPEWSIEVHS